MSICQMLSDQRLQNQFVFSSDHSRLNYINERWRQDWEVDSRNADRRYADDSTPIDHNADSCEIDRSWVRFSPGDNFLLSTNARC